MKKHGINGRLKLQKKSGKDARKEMKKTGQNEKWKSFAERKERLEKQNKHKTDQLANETLEDRTARLEH